MKQIYQFGRLIRKYACVCKLETSATGGHYVGGEWVSDPAGPATEISGAVFPMSDRKVYQSGGSYTEQDRVFLTQKEIPLEPAAYLLYQEDRYHVESETDYSDYAGIHAYNLKKVGAFDRSRKD